MFNQSLNDINVTSTDSFFLLLDLFLNPKVRCNKLGKLSILNFLVGIETSLVQGSSSTQYGGRFWLNNNGGLELGNENSCFLSQDWERAQKLMIHALLNTNFGTSEILKSSDREWESCVILHNLGEETSSTLALKAVLLVQLSAVNSGSSLCLSTHAVTSGGINIKMDNISWSKFPVLNSLLWSLLIDNAFISVDQVLLGLVRENTLHWLNLVVGHDSSDLSSHILVEASNLDRSSGSQESIVGSENNISSSFLSLSSDNNGVSTVRSKAVNVGSELNFDNILVLELG